MDIGVRWKKTSGEPAYTTNHGGYSDMPASRVESVCAVGQGDCAAESDDPRWHREQLSFNGAIAETGNDCGCEKGKRALRDNVGDLK